MIYESADTKLMIQRWCRLAIQLNGAADTGRYGHITVDTVVNELARGNVFDLLTRELAPSVWTITKLTDVDRHVLTEQWRLAAQGYEPRQFHVERNARVVSRVPVGND